MFSQELITTDFTYLMLVVILLVNACCSLVFEGIVAFKLCENYQNNDKSECIFVYFKILSCCRNSIKMV